MIDMEKLREAVKRKRLFLATAIFYDEKAESDEHELLTCAESVLSAGEKLPQKLGKIKPQKTEVQEYCDSCWGNGYNQAITECQAVIAKSYISREEHEAEINKYRDISAISESRRMSLVELGGEIDKLKAELAEIKIQIDNTWGSEKSAVETLHDKAIEIDTLRAEIKRLKEEDVLTKMTSEEVVNMARKYEAEIKRLKDQVDYLQRELIAKFESFKDETE